MAFQLKKREPIPGAIRRVVCKRIDRALATFKNANGAVTDHAVHDVRKRFKEIRGTLRLVRGELGEKTFDRENRAYRDAGRPLSTVRDAKILVDSLDALTKHFNGRLDPRKFAWLRRALLDRRRETRAATLQRDHAVTSVVKTLREAHARVNKWPLKRKGWKAIEGGLHKVYKQGRRAMKAATDNPSDDALHEWRKRAKDLRYELELLSGIHRTQITPLAKQAKRLTDLLGDDHDLCVLAAFIREHPHAKESPADVKLIESRITNRRATLQKQSRALGKKLYNQRPRDFLSRLHTHWKAAHQRKPA